MQIAPHRLADDRFSISLGGLLFQNDPHTRADSFADTDTIKMGFSGSFDLAGEIWGAGVKERAQHVADTVRRLIASAGATAEPSAQDAETTPFNKIILNIYGFSRGGIEALLVAIYLKAIDPALLAINLALIDPVPGNHLFIHKTLGTGLFGETLAQQALDLSECHNLNNVLCLYSQKLGNDHHLTDGQRHHLTRALKSFFASLAPTWPNGCHVEEDVIHGYHSDTQNITYRHDAPNTTIKSSGAALIAYHRCREFLNAHGAKILDTNDAFSQEQVIKNYAHQNKYFYPSYQKECHASSAQRVFIRSQPRKFYNLHHQSLELATLTRFEPDDLSPQSRSLSIRKINTTYGVHANGAHAHSVNPQCDNNEYASQLSTLINALLQTLAHHHFYSDGPFLQTAACQTAKETFIRYLIDTSRHPRHDADHEKWQGFKQQVDRYLDVLGKRNETQRFKTQFNTLGATPQAWLKETAPAQENTVSNFVP